MATVITGVLKIKGSAEPDRFHVLALFEQRLQVGDKTSEFAPARVLAPVTQKGAFQLEIPIQSERRGGVQLLALDVGGLQAGLLSLPDNGPFKDLTLPAVAVPPTVVNASPDLTLGAQLKYTGRVIDPAGRALPGDLLVVIWARPDGATAETPVSVARTSAGGYFSGIWPATRFSHAFAVVSGGDPLPIPLEDSFLPRSLIVVVPAIPSQPASPDDCDCDIPNLPRAPDAIDLATNSQVFAADFQRCVNFSIPNRALEEVSYQAVVRTTQPELKGSLPPTAPPVPPGFVNRLAELAQLRPTDIRLDPSSPTPGRDLGNTPITAGLSATQGAAQGITVLSASLGPKTAANRLASAAATRALALAPGLSLDGGWSTPAETVNERATQVLQARAAARKPLEFEASVLAEMAREPGEITPSRLLVAEHTSVVRRVRSAVQVLASPGPARFELTDQHQLDWEANPDAYQATTIAHGHLLTLKQVWRADGYSMGDLLYSIPLAPGQQKLISVLDWNRSEIATRRASRLETENLTADLVHDRDVSDIINATLSEHMEASSHADVKAAGGGIGGFIGPLVFGAAGGVSSAGSTASQTSGRDVTGLALNHVRDRTLQSASAVRGQRSTVVQTARQGESVRAQTEVIANYNHCHAITIEYFEVLRHFQVSQELAHVQECLFVPFAITPFNEQKTLRWREILQRWLRKQQLAPGFDSLARKVAGWEGADMPDARYADELVTYLDGDFIVRIRLPRPDDAENGDFIEANWGLYLEVLWDTPQNIFDRYLGVALPASRNYIWDTRIAPGLAQRLLEKLKLELMNGNTVLGQVTIDPTMVTRFAQDRPLRVSLHANLPLPAVTRAQIERVRLIQTSATLTTLPGGAEMLIESGAMSYRTAHLNYPLFSDRRVQNDISLGDNVEIPTPLSLYEKRNPRELDRRQVSQLIDHLNEHIEYFHRAIWIEMDPNRRFLLLDGFIAPDAGGRSVASVVENRIIGIVGNCLVMPVAPGQRLDRTYIFGESTPDDLRHLYTSDPVPPMRLSVPTTGVFCEAVPGKCNSCEEIDDTRFWRWETAPIPDTPTLIAPLSTDTRRTTPPSLAPDQFPDAIVRLQETPAAPAPTGLAAAVNALGVNNIFKDLTGLALNQQNAAEALKASISTAQGFASKAGTLAQQRFLNTELDRGLNHIKTARDQNLITSEQAQQLSQSLLQGAIGEERPAKSSPSQDPAVQRAMDRVPTAKRGSLRVTRPEGTVEVKTGDGAGRPGLDVAIDPQVIPIKQPSNMTCWAAGGAMMASWRAQTSLTIESVLDSLGGDWRKKFDNNEGLTANQTRAFLAALKLIEEGPASYTPEGLARLLADKGALLEIGDDGIENNLVVHVRIITAVRGDGTAEGTTVILADSASGTLVTEAFTEFDRRHDATDPVRFGVGLFHF